MDKITNNPFLAKCNYLDIHSETRVIAEILVKQFIKDNLLMGSDKVLILHGKGTDVLRKATHDILKNHKYVSKYYYDGINYGLTVVELLKVDKNKISML